MKAPGLQGVIRRKGSHTTRPDNSAAPASKLVQRDATASGPDQLPSLGGGPTTFKERGRASYLA